MPKLLSALLAHVRNRVLSGIVVVLPVAVTVYVLVFLFQKADGLLNPYFEELFGIQIPGLGIITIFVLVYVVGMITTNVMGRKLVDVGEQILSRVPVAKGIYTSIKQLVENLLTMSEQSAFRKVVLVQYPRRGLYALGLATGRVRGRLRDVAGHTSINVFIPTTPNPTSGYLVLIPEEDVIYLDMTVEEGMKLIISGGIVAPEDTKLPKPVAEAIADLETKERSNVGEEANGTEGRSST